MPTVIIEQFGFVPSTAKGLVVVRGTAVGTKTRNRRAKGLVSIKGTAVGSKTINGSAAGLVSVTGYANGHINDEPDLHGTAKGYVSVVGSARGRRKTSGRAKGYVSVVGLAGGQQTIPERFYWNVTVREVPAAPVGNYHEFDARLTVGGVDIDIESWEVSDARNVVTPSVSITLADTNDRDAITQYSSIKFEVGTKISGVWVWDTKIDTGEATGTNYRITRDRDTFSFTAMPETQSRLNKTPETDLVVYDSSEMTLTGADFEPIRDTNGNIYETERKSYSGLKLYQLLNEVFVTRAGFSNVECNIGNFGLSRVDFQAGRPFVETIKSILGMFEPDISEDGGTLVIRDTTLPYDSGDPDPASITLADHISIDLGREYNRLDAIRLIYAVSRREYDYSTDRTEESEVESGTFGSSNFETITTTRTIREYFRASDPFTPIDAETVNVTTETVRSGITIAESDETFTFDALGNPSSRIKTISQRLPDIENGNVLSLLTVRDIRESWTYKPHPFELQGRYLSKHELIERGPKVIDADNQQLGEDFTRDYVNAYRGGNLIEGMTVVASPLRTLVEQFEPLRGGRVRISTYEVDNASKEPQVIQNDEQILSGSISTNGVIKSQKQMYVLPSGESIRSDSRIDTLNGGEVPLSLLIPLALRRLARSRRSPMTKRGDVPLYRRDIRKGSVKRLLGRSGEDLGIYVIKGFTVRGDRNSVTMTIEGDQV